MAYPQNLDAFDVLSDINETNITIINEYNKLLGIAKNSMTQADFKKADDYYEANSDVLRKVIPRASYFNLITDAIKEMEKYIITEKEQILVRDKDTNYTDKSQSDYDEVLANQAVGDIWIATSTITNGIDYTLINSIKVKNERGTYTELYTLSSNTYIIDIQDDNIKENSTVPNFKSLVYGYKGATTFTIRSSSDAPNYISIEIPSLKDGDIIILKNCSRSKLNLSHAKINNINYAFYNYGDINVSLETTIEVSKYYKFIFRTNVGDVNIYRDGVEQGSYNIGIINDNDNVTVAGLLDYNELTRDNSLLLDDMVKNNNSSNYFATLPDSTYGDYNTISSFKSRKLVGNTYSVSAVVDISISDNMLSSFNSAFNTYGEIEHGWYPLFQIGTMDSNNNFVSATFPENQYLGVFRMYDHQHVNAPEYCTLGITTNGVIVISGGNHTFKVGETWRLPFNITFTAI